MSDYENTSETDSSPETEYFEDLERSKNGNDEEMAERTNIADIIYREKLADLQDQLRQLDEGIHPVYDEILKKCEQEVQDRSLANEVYQSTEHEKTEKEYEKTMQEIKEDTEKSKLERATAKLKEEAKTTEAERANMKLCPDSPEPKATTSRELRSKQKDPTVAQRKREILKKIKYLLDEKEIDEDLAALRKSK